MLCEEARENLSAYLDKELTGPESEAVSAHLDACADCRALAEELRATAALVAGLPARAAPEDLAGDVQREIERRAIVQPAHVEGHPQERTLPIRRARIWPRLAAVAATVLLASGIAIVDYVTRTAPMPVLEETAAVHDESPAADQQSLADASHKENAAAAYKAAAPAPVAAPTATAPAAPAAAPAPATARKLKVPAAEPARGMRMKPGEVVDTGARAPVAEDNAALQRLSQAPAPATPAPAAAPDAFYLAEKVEKAEKAARQAETSPQAVIAGGTLAPESKQRSGYARPNDMPAEQPPPAAKPSAELGAIARLDGAISTTNGAAVTVVPAAPAPAAPSAPAAPPSLVEHGDDSAAKKPRGAPARGPTPAESESHVTTLEATVTGRPSAPSQPALALGRAERDGTEPVTVPEMMRRVAGGSASIDQLRALGEKERFRSAENQIVIRADSVEAADRTIVHLFIANGWQPLSGAKAGGYTGGTTEWGYYDRNGRREPTDKPAPAEGTARDRKSGAQPAGIYFLASQNGEDTWVVLADRDTLSRFGSQLAMADGITVGMDSSGEFRAIARLQQEWRREYAKADQNLALGGTAGAARPAESPATAEAVKESRAFAPSPPGGRVAERKGESAEQPGFVTARVQDKSDVAQAAKPRAKSPAAAGDQFGGKPAGGGGGAPPAPAAATDEGGSLRLKGTAKGAAAGSAASSLHYTGAAAQGQPSGKPQAALAEIDADEYGRRYGLAAQENQVLLVIRVRRAVPEAAAPSAEKTAP